MMTQRDKMLTGALYDATDPDLVAARHRATAVLQRYNALPPTGLAERTDVLRGLLGHVGERVEVVPPFQADYGTHITLGDGVFLNFGCVILDTAAVRIGAGTLVGPGVHFYAATHPVDPDVRRAGLELGAPITVGKNVWIGGGTILLAGVSVGDDSVIGAGSVVTRDVPAGVVAVGNPCRVLRPIDASA